MTRRLAVSIAAALLAAAVVSAQESGPAFDVKPATMFNQHLYYGSFSRPHAVAWDAKHSELWVADSGNGLIGVFRSDGAELYSFSSKQFLRDPARIAIAPNGDVVVIEGDRAHLRRFSYRGDFKGDVALAGLPEKPILGAAAFDAEGKLYVGENRTSQVFVYAADGKLRQQFGSRGTDEGQFQAIGDIAVAAEGTIYVLDRQAIAVQAFDSQGNFERGWGKHEMGAENFSSPSGIALDGKGHVLVSDELRHQVKIFGEDGKFLDQFGGMGDGFGQLAFPTAIATDAEGHVFVAERTTSRVQVFTITPAKH